MTIIVFLIDNSASMAQTSYTGVTFLDFARTFVDSFLKVRQRDAASKVDRYMLMGFDEYPRNVKAGWRETQAQFNEQLRCLRPSGGCQFSEALYNALRFVNLSRVNTGIENYGYGRFPSYTEPAIFIALVDAYHENPGADFVGYQPECGNLQFHDNRFPPIPSGPGPYIDEPFRWDHKLFTVFLALPGHAPTRIIERPPLTAERRQSMLITERMNGRYYELNCHRDIPQVLENIIQRVQMPGVFVRFERFGPPPPPVDGLTVGNPDEWKSQTVLISRVVKTLPSQSHWPIPEAFWADQNIENLNKVPKRRAYPEITFRCDPCEPVHATNIPFDKYEVEPCALTAALVDMKNPKICWQVFIMNSSKTNGLGYPFGYLKLASNLMTVNLFIYPYNYPLLLALMAQLGDDRYRRSAEFQPLVDKYFQNVPLYYVSPLKKILSKAPISHPFLEERTPNSPYRPSLINVFKQWKEQGREEFEIVCAKVAGYINPTHPEATKYFSIICGVHQLPMIDVLPYDAEPNEDEPHATGLLRNYAPLAPIYKDLKIAVTTTRYLKTPSSKFRNPYDIDREEIGEQLEKMRVNLDLQFTTTQLTVLSGGMPGQRLKLQHAEDLHSLPVGKMGDYQEYSKRLIDIGMGPMRELAPQAARPHAFGNPFKLDKKSMAIDEVGELSVNNEADQAMGNLPNGNSTNGSSNGADTADPVAVAKDPKLMVGRKRAASEPPGSVATPPATPMARAGRRKRTAGPLERDAVVEWRMRLGSFSMWGANEAPDSISYELDPLPHKIARLDNGVALS